MVIRFYIELGSIGGNYFDGPQRSEPVRLELCKTCIKVERWAWALFWVMFEFSVGVGFMIYNPGCDAWDSIEFYRLNITWLSCMQLRWFNMLGWIEPIFAVTSSYIGPRIRHLGWICTKGLLWALYSLTFLWSTWWQIFKMKFLPMLCKDGVFVVIVDNNRLECKYIIR